MAPRLLAGIGWGTVGAAVYAACQWGMLIVLANVGSVSDVGRLSIALAVTAPIFLFFGLNLRVAQATDARREFDVRDYFVVRAVTTLAALLVVLFASVSWAPIRESWLTILLVASAKTSEAFTEVVIGQYQQSERFDLIGQLQISRGITGLVAFTAGFLMSHSLNVAVAMWSLAWLLLLVATSRRQLSGSDALTGGVAWSSASLTKCRKLLVVAVPLGLVAVMDSLVLNVPKYFLQTAIGVESVGVFSAIAYLMAVGGIAVGAIGYSITPRLARIGASQPELFLPLVAKAVALGFLVGTVGLAAAVLGGNSLLKMIYSDAFAGYQNELVIVMVAATLWYVAGLLGCGINALRRFHIHAAVQAAALCVTIVACIGLIPARGLIGAAVALALGMAARLIGSGIGLYLSLRVNSNAP